MGTCASAPVCEHPHALQYDVDDFPEHGLKMRTDATVEEVYTLGPRLGTGGFSKVRLATRRADGQQFAAKVVPLPRAGATVNEHCCSRARILAEVEALVGLQHPHIVRLHEYFVTKHHVYLITELLLGGEVLDALNQQEEGHFSEGEARTIFRQLMDAVAYLHSCGIVHRDIKLDNLLLAQPGDIEDIKIVDFGFAKKHPQGDGPQNMIMSTAVGTFYYVAPEVMAGRPPGKSPQRKHGESQGGAPRQLYGPACDVWSCGVVLYMLLCGEPPFTGTSTPALLRAISVGKFGFDAPVWRTVSAAAKDLVRRLIVVDPAQRLTAQQALAHPWLRSRQRRQWPAMLQLRQQPEQQSAEQPEEQPAEQPEEQQP